MGSEIDFAGLFQGATGILIGLIVGVLLSFLWDMWFYNRRLTAYRIEEKQLRDGLNRALTERADIQQEADLAGVRAAQAQARVREMEELQKGQFSQRNVLSEELDSARVRLRQLTATEQANETLRNQLGNTEGRLREQAERHVRLEQALEVVKTEQQTTVARLRESLGAAETRIETLTQENDSLRQGLAAAEAGSATVQARLHTAAEEAEGAQEAESRLQAAHREIEGLRARLVTTTARADRLAAMEKENHELQNRLESAEEELLTENNRLVAAEVKLQNLGDQLTDERLRSQVIEKQLAGLQGGTLSLASRSFDFPSAESVLANLAAETVPETSGTVEMAAAGPAPTHDAHDRLQTIHGVGNVFAGRLHAAGIHTWADMAAQSPETLSGIVQAKPWQNVDFAAWIAEARHLAAGGDAA